MNGLEQIEKLFRANTLTAVTDGARQELLHKIQGELEEIYKDDEDFSWALVDVTLPEDVYEGMARYVARTIDSMDMFLIVNMYDVGTVDMTVDYFYTKGFFLDSAVWHVVSDKACIAEGSRFIQRIYHKFVGKDDFTVLTVKLAEGVEEPNVRHLTPWTFTVIETKLNKEKGVYEDTVHLARKFFGSYRAQEYMKEHDLELPFYVDGDIVPREGVIYEQRGQDFYVVTGEEVKLPAQKNVDVPAEEFDARVGLDVYAGDRNQVIIPAPDRQDLPEHEPVVEGETLTFDTYEEVEGMRPCRKEPIVVYAKQVDVPFRVKSLEGDYAQGKVCDYLMTGVDGEHYICDQALFNRIYEWVPGKPVCEESIIPEHNSQELLEEFIKNEEESKEEVNESLFHVEEITQDDFAEDVGPVVFNAGNEVVISREKYPDSNAFEVEVKYPWDLAQAKRNEDGKISLEEFEKVPAHVYFESSVDDSYIGNKEFFNFLESKDIRYVMSYGENRVASIGFSPAYNKWYGWSHRAMYDFGIGDEVREGDLTNMSGYTDEYLAEHPEADLSLPVGFVAKNLNDAKRMAIAFADAVV